MGRDGATQPSRLASIDAYRGFVMLLLLAEVLRFCTVSVGLPDSSFWRFLCYHQTHAAWVGVSLHDMIMPSFCFLVGMSLAYSLARRKARGATPAELWRHVVLRSFLLIALGMANIVIHNHQVMYPFDWILPQIGLGYIGLFWVSQRPAREAWFYFVLILILDWLAFALYPTPATDFDYSKVGVSQSWLNENGLTGFEAHWQKNSNVAWAFDVWLLNLFQAESPLGFARGLTTLNFVPTISTMILGLIAGRVVRSEKDTWEKLRWLVSAGVLGILSGWLLSSTGYCPLVKWLWTPSWVLFSGGLCLNVLAFSFLIVDVKGYKRVVFPLIVIGMNS